MKENADQTSPPPTSETPTRRRPRYKNPNRSLRREVRAALRGEIVNRKALTGEEAVEIARLKKCEMNCKGYARLWKERAESGGFTMPTGERLSSDACRAKAEEYQQQADEAFRKKEELTEAVNSRGPLFPTSHRNRRGKRYLKDRAITPIMRDDVP